MAGAHTLAVRTSRRTELVDLTERVQEVVRRSGIASGLCIICSPHTTAGVTVNERADPDVRGDLLRALERAVPSDQGFRHAEGNSDAHVKTSLVGTSATLPVEAGRLRLGTWQAIFFCEFDGPREREVWVQLLP